MPSKATADGRPSPSADVSNVLLLAPSLDPREDEVCGDLVTRVRPSEADVLCVSFSDSSDERIDAWRTHVGPDLPAKMSVVTVGDAARSAATTTSDVTHRPADVSVHAVSDPRDLTTLGVRITEQLSEWQGDGNRIVLDFDSLTPLLEHASRERVFQFMHVLKGRIESVDGIAHYHMDPSAHDEQEVNTFKALVDAVVDVRDDDA